MKSYASLLPGQLIKLDLSPTVGHEQRGYRPALVISNADFNQLCGGMIRVLPITSNMRPFPLHIPLPDGLPIHGVVELEHERTIDLGFREFKLVGHVPLAFLANIRGLISQTY